MFEREQLIRFYQQHSTKIIGGLIGFLFGLFVMWVGLFWALFITATTFAGYWLGARLAEDPEYVPEWIERLMSGGRR